MATVTSSVLDVLLIATERLLDGFADGYRRMAELMIDTACKLMGGEMLVDDRQMVLGGSGTVVNCRADQVERTAKGITVRRLKAGRLAKKEEVKPRYVLVQAAIRADHPNEEVLFEHVSLITGERRAATEKGAALGKKLEKYREAINAAGMGHFEASESQYCASCPYFFICPVDGVVRETQG
jgi:hypothetical protein